MQSAFADIGWRATARDPPWLRASCSLDAQRQVQRPRRFQVTRITNGKVSAQADCVPL
jgi:hypothetical protein